jgi:hypothetical protein
MKNTNSGLLCWFVLLSLWMCSSAALAQNSILSSTPTNNYLSQTNNNLFQPVGPSTAGSGPFGGPFMGTSGLAGVTANAARYLPTGPPLASWGPFGVYPHLMYTLSYGNGLEARPGENSTTLINTVAPGVFLKMGALWFIDYTPSVSFYSNPLFHNVTDQKVDLAGAATNGNWMLNLSQRYLDTTQPLQETGTQLEQQAYATAFNATGQLGDQTSLQLGVSQNFRFTPNLVNLHEWTTADWLSYQFQPQLSAALGVTAGYDELSEGSSNPFEQALGRVIFQPGNKLSLMVIGGVEDRQVIDPSAPSIVNPIFQALATYQIRDGTLLKLIADRMVTPSLFANDLNVITIVSANLHQDIIGHFSVDLSGGYTDQSFTSLVPGPLPKYYFGSAPRTDEAVIRSDTRTFARITFSTVIRTRLTASIFAMLTDGESSQANFAYSGHQVGLTLDYRY